MTYQKISASSTGTMLVSGVEIIELSHNDTAANIYVRFDAKPTVTTTQLSQTSGKISWTWSDSVQSTGGYEIYRNGTTTANLIKTITDPSVTTYTDTGLTTSGHYTYYVRAYDAFTELPGKKYYLPFSDGAILSGHVAVAVMYPDMTAADTVVVSGYNCKSSILYTDQMTYVIQPLCRPHAIKVTNSNYKITFSISGKPDVTYSSLGLYPFDPAYTAVPTIVAK